jgi:adenylate kinase family enzyme
MNNEAPLKVVVIGNIAGGKTRMSRRLAELHNLPLIHIDSIQFLPGMAIRPLAETRDALNTVTAQEKWLIDGFGPLDILEKRFALADRIVFIDLPLWRHQWWTIKRQISNLWSRRSELPEGCDERDWEHTKKIFKTLRQVDSKMLPELRRILNRDTNKPKTIFIHNLGDWNALYSAGLINFKSK